MNIYFYDRFCLNKSVLTAYKLGDRMKVLCILYDDPKGGMPKSYPLSDLSIEEIKVVSAGFLSWFNECKRLIASSRE